MLYNCDLYPGVEKLEARPKDIFTEVDVDDDDIVNLKQWMINDNFTNLSTLHLSLNEFLNEKKSLKKNA